MTFRPLAALVLALVAISCTRFVRGAGTYGEADLARSVTIVRDAWGVAHVYGPTDASVAFGAAFAQAEDGYWQIEAEYVRALRRNADLQPAAADLERLSREEYAREPAERRVVWDAFTAGLNYYLRVSGVQPRSIVRWEPWMLFARSRSPGRAAAADSGQIETERTWAVAPARSSSGRALLLHSALVPVAGPGQLYEVHLHSDAGWHIHGFAPLGTLLPVVGHNEQVAWALLTPMDTTAAGGALQQLYAMSRAVDSATFRAALAPRLFPGGVTYADVAGNIFRMDSTRVTFGERGVMVAGGAREADVPDSLTSLETLAGLAFEARFENVAAELAPLVHEWEEVGGTNPARAMRIDEAVDLLRGWDGRASATSAATTLYVLWQERLRSGHYTGAYIRLRALEDVVIRLQADWRTSAVAWGEINRLQRVSADPVLAASDDRPSWPLTALPLWSHAPFIAETYAPPSMRRRYATSAAWIYAVELGVPARALSVVPFGQSADPASPVHADQAELYARHELKPALFTREQVAEFARRSYRPSESVTVPASSR